MATNLVPKSSEKYSCEICDFNCSRKSKYKNTFDDTQTSNGNK